MIIRKRLALFCLLWLSSVVSTEDSVPEESTSNIQKVQQLAEELQDNFSKEFPKLDVTKKNLEEPNPSVLPLLSHLAASTSVKSLDPSLALVLPWTMIEEASGSELAEVASNNPYNRAVASKMAEVALRMGVSDAFSKDLANDPKCCRKAVSEVLVAHMEGIDELDMKEHPHLLVHYPPESVHSMDMKRQDLKKIDQSRWMELTRGRKSLWYSKFFGGDDDTETKQYFEAVPSLFVGANIKHIEALIKSYGDRTVREEEIAKTAKFLLAPQVQVMVDETEDKIYMEDMLINALSKMDPNQLVKETFRNKSLSTVHEAIKSNDLDLSILLRMEKLLLDPEMGGTLEEAQLETPFLFSSLLPIRDFIKFVNGIDINNELIKFNMFDVKHLSHGQGYLLMDKYMDPTSQNEVDIPMSLVYAVKSSEIHRIKNVEALLPSVRIDKMLPSQRMALFDVVADNGLRINALHNLAKTLNSREILRYTTQEEFSLHFLSFIRKFLGEIKASENSKRQNMDSFFVRISAHFPTALLSAWLEEVRGDSDWNAADLLDQSETKYYESESPESVAEVPTLPALLGLTCADLEKVHPLNVTQILAVYRHQLELKYEDELNAFPLTLRKCFKHLVIDYLNTKADLYGVEVAHEDLLNLLTPNDLVSIGGEVLSAFPVRQIMYIKDEGLRRFAFKTIGEVPMATMMSLVSLDKYIDYAANVYNITHEEVDFSFEGHAGIYKGLMSLGSAAFFENVSSSAMSNAFEKEEFHKAMNSFFHAHFDSPSQKLVCLPKNRWTSAVEMMKNSRNGGNISSWTSLDLINFGDLLLFLDQEQLDALQADELRRAVPTLLKESLLDKHYDSFGGSVGPVSFIDACEEWLGTHEVYKNASHRLYRKYLQASQLNVNLALTEPSDRQRRDVSPDSKYNRVLVDKAYTILTEAAADEGLPEDVQDVFAQTFGDMRMQLVVELNEKFKLNLTQEDVTEMIMELLKTGSIDDEDSLADFMYVVKIDLVKKLVGLVDPTMFNMTRANMTIISGFDIATGLPVYFTCNGIKAAGKAGIALRPADLDFVEQGDLKKCLEVLGSIPWPHDVELEMWHGLKNRLNMDKVRTEFSGWKMILLGRFLPVIYETMPELLAESLESPEVVSLMGQLIDNETAVEDIRRDHPESDPAFFPKQLCRFDHEDLDLDKIVRVAGLIECSDTDRLANLTSKVIEHFELNPAELRPSKVRSLGALVGGFSPNDLAALRPAAIGSIQPAAAKHLDVSHLSQLSPDQLSQLPVESVMQLKFDEHLEDGLSLAHKRAIRSAVDDPDNMPKALKELQRFIRLADSFSTTTTTPAPAAPVVEPGMSKATIGSIAGGSFTALLLLCLFVCLFYKRYRNGA